MDQTLQALGGILLKAIPTICLLLIVHLYLKWMFFRPVREMLEKRREVTEGARETAAAMLKQATEKAAALEAELHKARDEIYRENEEARKRWIEDQASRLEKARQQSRELIHQAKQQLDAETAAAKNALAGMVDGLAEDIARTLLERKAS